MKENLRTVTTVFTDAIQRPPTQVAFRYSDGSRWHDISWPAYYQMAEKIACGLASLGVKRGDRVAIMSNTRYQWSVSDMAILGLGAVTVPIYQNNTVEDVGFILENSASVAAFIEDDSQLKKIQALQKESKIQGLKHLVSFTPLKQASENVLSWEALQGLGEEFLKTSPDFFKNECHKTKLDELATIVYTSGTTGQPKGVMLLHSCIASECEDVGRILKLDERDSTLTFLPFAHIFGRIEHWVNVYLGWKMCFAESIDRIGVNLPEIKPTVMLGVPRIFEKIYGKITGGVQSGSPAKRAIFNWALQVGREVSLARRERRELPWRTLLQYQLAQKLVFSKIQSVIGGNLRFFVSGGAPLSPEIAEFFHAAGILILEGYGLTETTAAICVNLPHHYKFGTVGPALGDTQLRIADDGEILVKSKKVFHAYFENEAATNEALTDGWFHTGDIGEIDPDGFLRITDRKKDLIKTAGGKMIAPQKIENLLKTNRFISQVLVVGDKMKYLVALITLNPDEIKSFAKAEGLETLSYEELTKNNKVKELIDKAVRDKNRELASYETIKNFAILPQDFTVESGELTPSLKIKRKLLTQKYRDSIEQLYK